MAVTAKVYNKAITSLLNKEIDWGSDTIKCMLTTSSYTPSQTNHQYKSSVTNEVSSSGTGYTTGGQALASKTEVITGQVLALDAANTVWSTSSITARYAVIYDDTPATDATKPLIAYVDFGADVTSSSGDFTIAWDSAGIVTITVA